MKSAFETGVRKMIPSVLVYVRWRDDFLLIHRFGVSPEHRLWNALGGKCEIDESIIDAAWRELHEESGLDLPRETFDFLGVLQFPNFKPHKQEDWVAYVFYVELNTPVKPSVHEKIAEGDLHWVPWQKFDSLVFWEGDRYFLPYVLKRVPFIGTFWFTGSRLEKHWVQPCRSF